jgi:DNA helicase HerA-like ATPase
MASLNFDDLIKKLNGKADNTHININPLCPVHPFRMLICAASGAGKTNILLDMILAQSKNIFHRVYLCCGDPTEPKYEFLIQYYRELESKTGLQHIFVYDNIDDFPTYEEFDPNFQNLVVIDDMVGEKDRDNKFNRLFKMGRKRNISTVYITQSFFKTPLFIRQQLNYIILMKLKDTRDLRGIVQRLATDVSFNELQQYYAQCTQKPYGWLLIDTATENPKLKFRCGWKISLPSGEILD